MSSDHDDRRRTLLGSAALGRLTPAEQAELDAALTADPSLRRELDELVATAGLLAHVDGTRIDDPVPAAPAHLGDRVRHAIATEARRRRTRRALAAAAAVVVLVVGGIVVPWTGTADGPDERAFPSEVAGVEASFTLAGADAGTVVTLTVDGLPSGVYWLWVTDEADERTGAGTFRGGRALDAAVFTAALPAGEAARVWVTDEAEQVVLDAHLP